MLATRSGNKGSFKEMCQTLDRHLPTTDLCIGCTKTKLAHGENYSAMNSTRKQRSKHRVGRFPTGQTSQVYNTHRCQEIYYRCLMCQCGALIHCHTQRLLLSTTTLTRATRSMLWKAVQQEWWLRHRCRGDLLRQQCSGIVSAIAPIFKYNPAA